MKKILAMILALMLVLTMTAGIVVMADEPVETANEQTEGGEAPAGEGAETTVPEIPSDVDMNSLIQYMIYDFKTDGTVGVKQAYIGTDPTLEYLKSTSGQDQQLTIEVINGKKMLVISEESFTYESVGDTGVGCIVDEGFFADKMYISVPLGSFENYVQSHGEGTVLFGMVMDFNGSAIKTIGLKHDNGIVEKEVKVGEQNSFVVLKYTFNWINILIAAMCLVVLILLALVIVAVSKKKKVVKVEEENDETLTGEEIFNALATETEEVEEISEEAVEEVVEETVEEVAEETAEEVTEE